MPRYLEARRPRWVDRNQILQRFGDHLKCLKCARRPRPRLVVVQVDAVDRRRNQSTCRQFHSNTAEEWWAVDVEINVGLKEPKGGEEKE